MLLDTLQGQEGLCLAEYTHRELIVPCLEHRDLPGILGELARALHKQGCLSDPLPFYHAALNRECLLDSSGLRGVAFPHARSTDVRSLKFALGRAQPAVAWNTAPQPIHLVFLIAVPATQTTPYMQLLAALARLSRNREWMNQLCNDRSSNDMFYHLYG